MYSEHAGQHDGTLDLGEGPNTVSLVVTHKN
jgi:hypothetical protein